MLTQSSSSFALNMGQFTNSSSGFSPAFLDIAYTSNYRSLLKALTNASVTDF